MTRTILKKTCVARYNAKKECFVELNEHYNAAFNLVHANLEQRYALELLLDPEIELVSLIGQAGTGKTLLALAAGLECVIYGRKYEKILVSKPIMPLGNDIGYLPGDKEEKLSQWMQPIYDNMEFMLSRRRNSVIVKSKFESRKKGGKGKEVAEDVKSDSNGFGDKVENYIGKSGPITLEAITYIRGRSIPRQYIIIDEAQNLTPHEVKTIISRAGKGTKVILTGDPEQIDNPYLDSASNGLTYVVEQLKNLATIGHITLSKTERSGLANIAATYL